MSYYDELPPEYYRPPDDDLTELADDDERHWRGLAELALPGDGLGEPEGPDYGDD
jgi:hypothetical protein